MEEDQSEFKDHVDEITVYFRTAVGSVNRVVSSDVIPDKTGLPDKERDQISDLLAIAESDATKMLDHVTILRKGFDNESVDDSNLTFLRMADQHEKEEYAGLTKLQKTLDDARGVISEFVSAGKSQDKSIDGLIPSAETTLDDLAFWRANIEAVLFESGVR